MREAGEFGDKVRAHDFDRSIGNCEVSSAQVRSTCRTLLAEPHVGFTLRCLSHQVYATIVVCCCHGYTYCLVVLLQFLLKLSCCLTIIIHGC